MLFLHPECVVFICMFWSRVLFHLSDFVLVNISFLSPIHCVYHSPANCSVGIVSFYVRSIYYLGNIFVTVMELLLDASIVLLVTGWNIQVLGLYLLYCQYSLHMSHQEFLRNSLIGTMLVATLMVSIYASSCWQFVLLATLYFECAHTTTFRCEAYDMDNVSLIWKCL